MQKIKVVVVGILLLGAIDTTNAKQMKRVGVATSVSPSREIPSRSETIKPFVAQPIIQPSVTSEISPVMNSINKDVVIRELDKQLASSIDSAWNEQVDDLLLDLAIVDREMARKYFQKIRDKRMSMVNQPSESVVDKPIVAPIETITEVSSLLPDEEPMKKAAGRQAPAKRGAPSGGPAKKIGASKESSEKPAEKVVVQKPVEQIFSVPILQKLDNDKLLELFAGLLEKLPSSWNGQAVEKIEEKTKYGSKIYNVYGAPIPKWANDMSTLKKVLVSKKIMTEEEVAKQIADRIMHTREQKNVKPSVVVGQEEKPKEELSEQDLVRLIKAALDAPNNKLIGWHAAIRANIKALNKLNPEAAGNYDNKYREMLKTFSQ